MFNLNWKPDRIEGDGSGLYADAGNWRVRVVPDGDSGFVATLEGRSPRKVVRMERLADLESAQEWCRIRLLDSA